MAEGPVSRQVSAEEFRKQIDELAPAQDFVRCSEELGDDGIRAVRVFGRRLSRLRDIALQLVGLLEFRREQVKRLDGHTAERSELIRELVGMLDVSKLTDKQRAVARYCGAYIPPGWQIVPERLPHAPCWHVFEYSGWSVGPLNSLVSFKCRDCGGIHHRSSTAEERAWFMEEFCNDVATRNRPATLDDPFHQVTA